MDTRLTREADGLGLGLAIAQRVVDLHGGTIWVESTPDIGSAFHAMLPLISVDAVAEDEIGDQIKGETERSRDQHGGYALPDVIEGQSWVRGGE